MFKQIANIAQVMRQAQAMQGRLQELKDRLSTIQVTGTAGNGAVAVDVSGDQRILAVRIDDQAAQLDLRTLEAFLAAATNDALDRAKLAAAETMQSATGEMPGMSELMSQLGSSQ